jgi:hypothetical protein
MALSRKLQPMVWAGEEAGVSKIDDLGPKQRRFCEDLNATKAAIRARNSAKIDGSPGPRPPEKT